MPAGYTPIRVEHISPEDEMNAAFDNGSDDEEDVDSHHPSAARTPLLSHTRAQSQPSIPTNTAPIAAPAPQRTHHPSGDYDFEYDYPPPPGSPPRPSALALPNNYGNSNGEIPVFNAVGPSQPNFFRRALGTILPNQYGRGYSRVNDGPIGGGMQNDGVFANVTAKPGGTAPVLGAQADGPNWTPEDAQNQGPPSYSVAQADAVPPYWETTVLAPTSVPGELIVDGLATGSLFSFLWNLLVSMSFQFVGFLLTYLLHTTHAGKYGSRAGLGVTLIQYGFYLRAKTDDSDDPWGWPNDDNHSSQAKPTFATAAEADKYYSTSPPADLNNSTAMMGNGTMLASEAADATAANDWLSFFLMTIGWFVLLTSLMGYWRVKRWEHGVVRASAETAQSRQPTEEEMAHDAAILANIERVFGIVSSRAEQMRNDLGLPSNWAEAPGTAARPPQNRCDSADVRCSLFLVFSVLPNISLATVGLAPAKPDIRSVPQNSRGSSLISFPRERQTHLDLVFQIEEPRDRRVALEHEAAALDRANLRASLPHITRLTMDERPTHTNLRLTTASDCLILMEGVRRGMFRLVTRRLTDAERSLYIKPGCVFTYLRLDHVQSPMTSLVGRARFCDRNRRPLELQQMDRRFGLGSVSHARAIPRTLVAAAAACTHTSKLFYHDAFQFYDEKPASGSGSTGDALDPSSRANTSARGRAAPYDRGPKPSTKNTYGGLVKQTFSTLVRMNDDNPVKWHVVAYFTTDSHSNIPGVKDDPNLKDIDVPHGVYESARQRKPGTATRDRSTYGKERASVKSEHAEGMSSPLPSPVPIPRRYSTQAVVPGLSSPTSSLGYVLPSPASVPDLTRMYQKRPTSDTHSPPPQYGPPMSWPPKYQEEITSPFAFSPPFPTIPFRPENDFSSIPETLHIPASREVVDFSGAAPPFNDAEPPKTLEAFRFFEQRLSGARHFALIRPMSTDDHLMFYGPSLHSTIDMSALYETVSTSRRRPSIEFLTSYFRPNAGFEGGFNMPFTISLSEPIRHGQNKWAQVWRANLRCSTVGGWSAGIPVVVKLFQESLFPPPTPDDLLGDKSECAWYSMKEQAEAEAWAYEMLKSHQGQHIPYSYGMYEFTLPCGEERVIGHVMEDVTSWTLDEYLHIIGGEANIEQTWQIATAAVQGLQSIHASGVAHRDLKPRHILVPKEQHGTVVFVDFTYSASDGPADSQPLYDTLRESGFVNGIDKWVASTGGHNLLANLPAIESGSNM
ncbi:hypothetical protein RHS02_03064, partial [Rhizoctonia solani]